MIFRKYFSTSFEMSIQQTFSDQRHAVCIVSKADVNDMVQSSKHSGSKTQPSLAAGGGKKNNMNLSTQWETYECYRGNCESLMETENNLRKYFS